jgi:hypothetical protein
MIMNSEQNMKNLFDSIRRFSALTAMIAVAGLLTPLSAQNDVDMAITPLQIMVVDGFDAEAGTVTLDGNTYRVSLDKRPASAMAAPNKRALRLSDLKPGMEIVISTDGSEPTRTHQPMIIGIWEPD